MFITEDSIIFLLGAGASVDAGIMHAKEMTDDIESKIKEHDEFKGFESLYNFLKSSIVYQRGLHGRFIDRDVNIEELLNVLAELKQKDKNKLYPFIGSWNVHLQKVAGDNFEKITDLDKQIRKQLFQWINIDSYRDSSYFSGLNDLAKDMNRPLRVFTLNYDICVERALGAASATVELGFNDSKWEASRFDPNDNAENSVYLYKLHGSIDWKRDEEHGHVLKKCDSPTNNPELIFGTTAKLSSIDPYLFYVHEFRKYSLREPLRFIVTVGYSFSDDYINRLIGQAIKRNPYVNILTVSPTFRETEEEKNSAKRSEINRIAGLLNIDPSRVLLEDCLAKEFFENNSSVEYFQKLVDRSDDSPF